jgi:Na/Pi-cotransporter
LLGGEGMRHPVPDVEVLFRVDNPESGAIFEESSTGEARIKTNAAGNASATLRLGGKTGDVFVTASLETPSGIEEVSFHATAGLEIIGAGLEAGTGAIIPEVGVRLQDVSGGPAARVPVHFRVEGNDHGALVGESRVLTDENGRAVTSWKLGEVTQPYFVSMQIMDNRPDVPPASRFRSRAVIVQAMALNKSVMVITLFGGLAIFIIGMRLMSNGLQRMADRRLKSILQAMTYNRFLAVLAGLFLTALVQSSSATTVMTVGFVNAGLINLTQAIGVIFGANIGTTVTAQIIAFKLDSLAYPAIAVGAVMSGLGKRPVVKHGGETILGFGLLFLGMTTMSDTLKPLNFSPGFQSMFQWFDCTPQPGGMVPWGAALMCILIGTVCTVVVQSSSATIGLVLALSSQGLISFYTAVPLVLGDNIGTTITAILASMGANRNAKRAALAHTLFNVFGAIYMYVLLFIPIWNGHPVFLGLINAVTPGDAFAENPENLVRHVANAHSLFNVFNCVLFLPFIPQMAAVVRRIIPMARTDEESVLEYLEPTLLQTPSLALAQAVQEVAYMVRLSRKSINDGCELFFGGHPELEHKVLKREDTIDKLQHEITAYLVELSRKQLAEGEAELIPALLHAVNDAERIGDHSEDLVELTKLRNTGPHPLSEAAQKEIHDLIDKLNEQFDLTLQALTAGNHGLVPRAKAIEEEITEMLRLASDAHMRRLENHECQVLSGIIFLDFLANLERVADHLLNIVKRADRVVALIAA